jgi:hypothetical protein
MTTLTYPANTFDRDACFAFEYDYKGKPQRAAGYLFNDTQEGVIYILQKGSCLKAHYTEEDRVYTNRIYFGEEVLRSGDAVTVDGKQYEVKILGNYSDAGRLIPV